MKTNGNDPQQARGQIEIAIRRLAYKYPFHAAVLERLEFTPAPESATMGVTVAGDSVVLQYNPDFVLGRPMDQLTGVMLHEVHHVVFGHVLMDRDQYPDEWALTIAQEVTANEFVEEPLPEGAIKLKDFPSLPPMEPTVDRYERLKSESKRQPLSLQGEGEAETNQGASKRQDQSLNSSQSKQGLHTLDDHRIWDKIEDRNHAKSIIRTLLRDARSQVGANSVPDYLRSTPDLEGIGSDSGDDRHDLRGDKHQTLPWPRLLRRYVGRETRVRPDYRRPPRRFPSLVGVIPGRRRQRAEPHVMAVIDTSGSITPDLLERINSELKRLASDFEVTVVECDAQIQGVYPYEPIQWVQGRGGTDLRPPLEAKFLKKHRPDVVAYFTDGMGPAPADPPVVPVIWCLTPDGQSSAEWGHVVRMKASPNPPSG